jgi:hypothetical protein
MDEDRKARRAINVTKVLVALALAIAVFGAYFLREVAVGAMTMGSLTKTKNPVRAFPKNK